MADGGTLRWQHPEVVLAATDLNDLERLTPFAFAQANETGARLILMHVIGGSAGMAVDPVGMPYYDPSAALEYAAKTLEHWREVAQQSHITCNILIREGNAAQQIAAAVRQFKVDRIVLGTRSRSKVSKLLLGSVAEQVLRSVHLPVMTVGPEAHLAVSSKDDGKVVLHATTLRETSRPSAALASHIAQSKNAKLMLLHVLPPEAGQGKPAWKNALETGATVELQQLADSLGVETGQNSNPVEARVLRGNPAIEILATAAAVRAELIVLGATHRSAWQSLTRDHTIYRVLAHARCPVLTLREAADEASPLPLEPLETRTSAR